MERSMRSHKRLERSKYAKMANARLWSARMEIARRWLRMPMHHKARAPELLFKIWILLLRLT